MTFAISTLIILAAGLLLYSWRRGDGTHWKGTRQGFIILRDNAPLLLIAFTISGFVSVLSPEELISAWIGPDSGWKGIFLGEGLGMLVPGGPYVIFPLVSTFYEAGAGMAATITIITSWAALGVLRLAFELPFMGWRFSAIRFGLAATLPLIAGGLALWLFGS
jgi:uncharacterized membrane protein YraQ (UPF0718 family)